MYLSHPVIKLVLALALLASLACYKPLDVTAHPIPANTLALEFAQPVKFVIDLKIDGETVPVKYGGKNRILWVEGLKPGEHRFNVHSISYVFGPEYENFQVSETGGAYFFIQSRKYRSSLPKNKETVSIRAYRKKLKKDGIDAKKGVEISESGSGRVRAWFTRGR